MGSVISIAGEVRAVGEGVADDAEHLVAFGAGGEGRWAGVWRNEAKLSAMGSVVSIAGEVRAVGQGVADDAEHLFSFGAGDGEAGRAGQFRAEADFGHAELDVLDELDFGIEVEERGVPLVEFAGFGPAALLG